MRAAPETLIAPASALTGTLAVPGDKSISHRYALLAALADGETTIANYAPGADCASTLACLADLGVAVSRRGPDRPGLGQTVTVRGLGVRGLRAPSRPLDCGNSGTTMRLLAGILAAHPFSTTLVGDASLSRRPMRRVIDPLSRMGATLDAADGRPPLTVHGTSLHGITFEPPTPSAQVKSAVLLAGLQGDGTTTVIEPGPSRDHTERAVVAFGAHIDTAGRRAAIAGGQRLTPCTLTVPGDISSAAFPLCAAAALPGSRISVDGVGLNPTRTGLLDLLRRWGADVRVDETGLSGGEPIGTVTVTHRGLGALVVTPEEVPDVIDELPVLGALATFGGEITVTGASELRVKESDRISALVTGFRAMGADAEELPDGFHIRGRQPLRGGIVDAEHDHRLAMAFAVAALGASAPTRIDGADVVAVSYPGFFEDLERLRA